MLNFEAAPWACRQERRRNRTASHTHKWARKATSRSSVSSQEADVATSDPKQQQCCFSSSSSFSSSWSWESPSRLSMFYINDHLDVLVEIMKRMDARTLARSSCVCRLWASISLHDYLWENLIVRHLSPPSYANSLRPVVLAMGGYRSLYINCVRPVLARSDRPLRSWDEVQLSLSLLSVDCYERRLIGSSSSLRFLCDRISSSHRVF